MQNLVKKIIFLAITFLATSCFNIIHAEDQCTGAYATSGDNTHLTDSELLDKLPFSRVH